MVSFSAKAAALLGEYGGLKSFSVVAAWYRRAETLVAELQSSIRSIEAKRASKSQELESKQQTLSGVAKMFGAGGIRQIEAEIAELQKERDGYAQIVSELESFMRISPRNETERAQILGELSRQAAEFRVAKRETAASMKAISLKARQDTAVLRGSDRTYRVLRQSIAHGKEIELAPLETKMAAIEQGLIGIDKLVLILQGIENDIPEET